MSKARLSGPSTAIIRIGEEREEVCSRVIGREPRVEEGNTDGTPAPRMKYPAGKSGPNNGRTVIAYAYARVKRRRAGGGKASEPKKVGKKG
jgi:hypothetical protein